MHQLKKIGGGESEEHSYTTWEIKVCPECGRKVLEYYIAKEIADEDIPEFENTNLCITIEKI